MKHVAAEAVRRFVLIHATRRSPCVGTGSSLAEPSRCLSRGIQYCAVERNIRLALVCHASSSDSVGNESPDGKQIDLLHDATFVSMDLLYPRGMKREATRCRAYSLWTLLLLKRRSLGYFPWLCKWGRSISGPFPRMFGVFRRRRCGRRVDWKRRALVPTRIRCSTLSFLQAELGACSGVVGA